MLEALAKGYASDVALKYQQHYQEALKAQAVLAETLINSVESEVQKAIFNKLALQGANAKLFASDLASTCRTEIDALLVYTQIRKKTTTARCMCHRNKKPTKL